VFQAGVYLSCDTGARVVRRYRVIAGDGGAPRIQDDTLVVGEGEPLALEIASFLSSVRSRRRPEVDGREGRRALELAHRVLRSIEANFS
jgi:hypothetical protein